MHVGVGDGNRIVVGRSGDIRGLFESKNRATAVLLVLCPLSDSRGSERTCVCDNVRSCVGDRGGGGENSRPEGVRGERSHVVDEVG